MFCPKCGKAIKDDAKFCKYCGTQISKNSQSVNGNSDTSFDSKNKDNTKILAVAIVVAAIVLVALVFAALSLTSDNGGDDAKAVEANKDSSVAVTSSSSSSSSSSQSSSANAEKSWVSVGSFSGSGSGSQSISVPAGEIRIDITAFPIKNYATNYLYLTGSNGESAGIDWGSTSAVASKSDSVSFTSSSTTTFTIDYYETESWSVEVYKYQWG